MTSRCIGSATAYQRWDSNPRLPVRLRLRNASETLEFDLSAETANEAVIQLQGAVSQAEVARVLTEENSGCNHADYCKCPLDPKPAKDNNNVIRKRTVADFQAPPHYPDRPIAVRLPTGVIAVDYLGISEAEELRDELDEKIDNAREYAAANPVIVNVEDLKPGDCFEDPDGGGHRVSQLETPVLVRKKAPWNEKVNVHSATNGWLGFPENQPVRLVSKGG